MVKKKRKMTEEQRAAAIERLAKAREKRMANAGPPQNVHPDVFAKPDDDKFSLKNVRQWIKNTKEQIPGARQSIRLKQKGAEAHLASLQGYVRHCEWYIRTGDWIDDFYGDNQQHKIRWKTTVPAYDKDGCEKT
jgi:hypothetical protein